MNLLIAIDGSEFSTAAVRRVAAMSWPAGSRVLLLAVVRSDVLLVSDFFVSATGEIAKILQEEGDRAEARLRELAPLLEAAHLSVTTRVERGDARSTIVETAESERCDLVVVGSHGRTGISRLVLGSVAAHVVAHAGCDVLVVRNRVQVPA
jgi:nucleotide-binding universal stress UspA family protein